MPHLNKLIVTNFILLLSSTSFAVANFSGHWVATSGRVSSNVPGLGNTDCTRVEIEIEQTETQLITKKYKSDCGLWGTHWGPVTQDIKNGEVFEDGEKVGTITDDTLITIAPSGTVAYAYNLKLVRNANGETIMKSYYGTQNAIGAIATEADHKKQ